MALAARNGIQKKKLMLLFQEVCSQAPCHAYCLTQETQETGPFTASTNDPWACVVPSRWCPERPEEYSELLVGWTPNLDQFGVLTFEP